MIGCGDWLLVVMVIGFCLYWGYMLLQVMVVGFGKNISCTASGRRNVSRVIPRLAVGFKRTVILTS